MHVPDRVLRQFGLPQHVPDPVERIVRGRRRTSHHTDWAISRAAYIQRWDNRWNLIEVQRIPSADPTTYMRWYWNITRRWIGRDPQPSASYTPCPPTDAYIPSAMIERDYVRVLDEIEADISQHIDQIQDPTALGVFQRIRMRIYNVFHKTQVDRFEGREDRSRYFGASYQRRRRPAGDDEAGTSRRAASEDDGAGTSQPHTQADTQIIEADEHGHRGRGRGRGRGKRGRGRRGGLLGCM